MTDLAIKNNQLQMSDGDFKPVSGVEELKQHLIVALNTFKWDWFLNQQKGIDYAYGFRHPYNLENDIKKQLIEVNNVRAVDNFEMTFDLETAAITVTAIVRTTYGKIFLNETLYTK